MTISIPGYSTLTGAPVAIIKLMQEARFFGSEESGDDYINSVKEAAKRCYGISLRVKGKTYEERAESLLRQMAQNQMIKLKD